MKRCPTCGAVCSDDDVFCESDGARLAPTVAAKPAEPAEPADPEAPPGERRGACVACGGDDDGDGFCGRCGLRLAMPTRPEVLVEGQMIGSYTVVRSRAGDGFVVRGAGGTDALAVLGPADGLAREAAALEALVKLASMPRVLERGSDPAVGAFMVLDGRALAHEGLVEAGPRMTLEAALLVIDGLLDLCETIDRAGLAWEPHAVDFVLSAEGRPLPLRLRGAAEGRPDAKSVIEVAAAWFLPGPALFGPPSLVRLLRPSAAYARRARRGLAAIREAVRQARDEVIVAPGLFGEVCDVGLTKEANQDATAAVAGEREGQRWAVLAVCDGVSSAPDSDVAARVAVEVIRDALVHFLGSGDVAYEAMPTAVASAVRAGHAAACAEFAGRRGEGAPGATVAVAVVYKRQLTAAWVGDSRVYWLTGRGAEQLTDDHSLAVEMVARGEMTAAEAREAPFAHTITRCIGPLEDADPAGLVDVRKRDLSGPGVVLVCSDGLWNYAPEPADMLAAAKGAGEGAGVATLARVLANTALAAGGQDNVSVVTYAVP